METTLSAFIKQFTNKKIMVIGDIIADVYLEGKISRISREAPVLVLEHSNETIIPGGAANVLHNVATLGGKAYAIGITGQDSNGSKLQEILKSKSVNTDGIYPDGSRPTITKTRIIAGGLATVRQHVVRIDKETREPLSKETESYLLAKIESLIPQMDAVVLDDYGSNSITPLIRERTISWCHSYGIPSIVDSRYNILAYTGVTLAKQNEAELAAAIGYPLMDEAALVKAGHDLLQQLNAQVLLITRGPDGISLFEQDGQVQQIPVTNVREVFDVSGAGDTVVATMMLALAAGATPVDAARMANFAAGIVISKLGTATTNQDELKTAIEG